MFKAIISIVLWPIWFCFFIPTMLTLSVTFLIVPRKVLYVVIRPLCWVWCLLGGQWLKRENNPPNAQGQPYLYMFNHSSMFDQFMIAAYVPHYITAVAAIEQFRYPLWGQIIKQYGVIPIIRQRLKDALNSLSLAEKALKSGVSFLISPEGTRTTTGGLSPFKKGPFHLAKNTGATIIPVGLVGAYRAKKKNDWRLTPGIIITRFGDPILQKEYENLTVDGVKDLVNNRIQKLIQV
tara:strand:+ start:1761 stop:2468 length:708 start_codon:yes stop_codon:yes gene_type:complete